MTAGGARSTAATATKKPATAVEAPVWKNYLAVRTEISASESWRLQLHGGGASTQARSRKRSKPSSMYAGSSGGGANWMAMPSQPQSRYADESASVAPRIRKYWEQLTANERQQILFIDEPDLVKQLYKLNLSLLCVGLMQRHLKTPLRPAAAAKSATTHQTLTAADATVSSVQPKEPAIGDAVVEKSTSSAVEAAPPVAAPAAPSADPHAEKTYELLEAMEFMDIGTGILTVKSELVEDPERLYTLVGDVLFGFVSTIHVLSEKQFYDLFVAESEVINTWEDYQRLIGMLVEQLIIKSYVSHLEKEAAIQMEELLLEVSLEDSKSVRKAQSNKDPSHIPPSSQKSKKKKKKKKKVSTSSSARDDKSATYQPEPEDFGDDEQLHDGTDPDASNASTATSADIDADETMLVDDADSAGLDEKTAEVAAAVEDDPASDTEIRASAVAPPVPDANDKRASSSLNPNASVFQPQQEVQLSTPTMPTRHLPIVGKRKLDKYIVNVGVQDVVSDDEYSVGGDRDLEYSSDDDFPDDALPPRRRQKRREEDAELEWHLQQIYSSTSTMLGWDFARQCDVFPQPGLLLPWDESALWRTAPKEVVRYFTPGVENGFGSFFPPGGVYPFPPGGGGVAAGGGGVGGGDSGPQPKSRYYFSPPSSSAMPLSTTFVPSGAGGSGPRMLPPSSAAAAAVPSQQQQHHPRVFAFQEADFRGVVTSPDFPSTKPELQDRLLRKKDHRDPE